LAAISDRTTARPCCATASSATINRWWRAYLRGAIAAELAGTPGKRHVQWWVRMIVRWVVALAPADFGFARSR
jgi:hypothetical protein